MKDLFIIDSEEKALEAIDKLLKKETITPVFKGWPVIEVHASGDQYHSSITSKNMAGLIAFQDSIYRLYAEIKSGKPNLTTLSKEEKDNLEIVYNVNGGSSTLDGEMANIVQQLVAKMTSIELMITIIVALVLYFGNRAWETHKTTQVTLQKDQQDTEREKIITDAMVIANKHLKDLAETAVIARNDLLKGFSSAENVDVQGNRFSNEEINNLTKSTRSRSSTSRKDGEYIVKMVDKPTLGFDDVRIRVFNEELGNLLLSLGVDASNKDTLTKLQNAQANELPIYLLINTKMCGEDIREAELIGIKTN